MKVNLFGIEISAVTSGDALAQVQKWWEEEGKHYIVTPNPEFVVYAQSDVVFRSILNQADIAIPDGVGLIWGAGVIGRPLPERITGADFAVKLIEMAAQQGKSVFFLGGRGGVAQEAAYIFKRCFPKLIVSGVAEGESDASGDYQTRKVLSNHKVDLLLVAYGHPRQEYWIQRNLPEINATVAMGVGGSFDYWSGRVNRAPVWMRRFGLEWLYRLIHEPWRIRRQSALLKFVWLVLKKKLSL